MGNQGAVRRQPAITEEERLRWAHDRMMEALKRAKLHRADPSLTTAAFTRMEEYDALLVSRELSRERKQREKESRRRRDQAAERQRETYLNKETT